MSTPPRRNCSQACLLVCLFVRSFQKLWTNVHVILGSDRSGTRNTRLEFGVICIINLHPVTVVISTSPIFNTENIVSLLYYCLHYHADNFGDDPDFNFVYDSSLTLQTKNIFLGRSLMSWKCFLVRDVLVRMFLVLPVFKYFFGSCSILCWV